MDLVFQALGQDFEVIHIKEMWQGYQILQCRTLNGTTQYTILRFEKEQYVKELLPIFFSLKENQAYEDYKGCFTKNGDLYVVFVIHRAEAFNWKKDFGKNAVMEPFRFYDMPVIKRKSNSDRWGADCFRL